MMKLILGLVITVLSPLGMATKHQMDVETMHANHLAYLQHLNQQKNKVGGVTFATVGFDSSCDFSGSGSIQDAIDDPMEYDEIRIVAGTHNENISINQRSVTLKGGYSDCAQAAQDNQDAGVAATVIAAVPSAKRPVITIAGNDQRYVINLEALRLQDGVNFAFSLSGGISTFGANLSLNLIDVWLQNNQGSKGGGISLLSGNTDVFAHNLLVYNNTASEGGGGIHCTGENNSILINGDDSSGYGIFQNETTNGNGGGVLLEAGCQLLSFVGTQGGELFDWRGIAANSATDGSGGGISVEGGSKAVFAGYQSCLGQSCLGYDSDPVSLTNNQANYIGGAVYVTGEDSEVTVYNGLIHNNSASSGGGVYVDSDASYITDSFFPNSGTQCWSPGACNQVTENRATGSFGGGAFYVWGEAEIIRTIISGNRANYGTAIKSDGDDGGGDTKILGSLITQNGDFGNDGFDDRSVIGLREGSVMRIEFTTIVDNHIAAEQPLIGSFYYPRSTLRIGSSIIHENSVVPIFEETNVQTTFDIDCLIVHELDSLPDGNQIQLTDPRFVDRASGNYRLSPNSPALDYCDEGIVNNNIRDIDNQARGFDWPDLPNNIGPYDIGYDEISDIIFKDGFSR